MIHTAVALLLLAFAAQAGHVPNAATTCSSQLFNQNPEMQINDASGPPVFVGTQSSPGFCCQACEQRRDCWSWDYTFFDRMRWFNATYNETDTFVTECRLFGIRVNADMIPNPITLTTPEALLDPSGGFQELRFDIKSTFAYVHADCSTNNTVLYHCGASICIDFRNECDGGYDCPGHFCPDGLEEAECKQLCNVTTAAGDVELCPIDEHDCQCEEFVLHPNNTNSRGVNWEDFCDVNCTFVPVWYVATQGTGFYPICPHATGENAGESIEGVCQPGNGDCPDDMCSSSGVCDDPHYVGFGGGMYDVQGEADKAFNLISTEHVSVNSLYVLQTEGFSESYHPEWADSTYLGPMGVHVYNNYFTLYPDCSAVVNDVYSQRLRQDQDPLTLHVRDEASGEVVATIVQGTFEFRVQVPEFSFLFQCTGHGGTSYFNMRATYYKSDDAVQPHGLLGQTADGVWRPSCKTCLQGEGAIDGIYLDYIVGDGEQGLRGTQFTYSKFAVSDKQAVSGAVTLGSTPGAVSMEASGFGASGDLDVDPLSSKTAGQLREEQDQEQAASEQEVQLF